MLCFPYTRPDRRTSISVPYSSAARGGTGSLAGVRAAVARRGALVVEEVPDPVPGPGDVLVAVKACGICGSDLHALHYADELVAITREMGVPIAFDPSRDFIMGHEFTAE